MGLWYKPQEWFNLWNTIQPNEDVRPVVRGKWTHRKSELWGGGYTICSACGYGYSDSHYHEVEEFSFCPNCGADMRHPDD